MPSLKDVRTRIASVKSTQQITGAMKMVAASKLRKAQNAILQLRPYAGKLNELLRNLTASLEASEDDYYSEKREIKNVLIVVMNSNRGLCGAFNSNVIKLTVKHLHLNYIDQMQHDGLHMITIGKYATNFFSKSGFNVVANFDSIYDDLNFEATSLIATNIMESFLQKKYDLVELVYNHFKNAALQELTIEQYLPVPISVTEEEHHFEYDFIFEPSREIIIKELIPRSLKIQFYKAVLDSYVAEQGARMTAMHQATDNARELLKDLKLSYNKARQASITKELLEIISGAEALKES